MGSVFVIGTVNSARLESGSVTFSVRGYYLKIQVLCKENYPSMPYNTDFQTKMLLPNTVTK